MSTEEEQRPQTVEAGPLAVTAVLAPVLCGAAAVVSLSIGYILKMLDPSPAFAQTLVTVGWVLAEAAVVAFLASVIGLLVSALRYRSASQEAEEEAEPSTSTRIPRARASLRTTEFASLLAGERRAHLREEWASVLAGDPGNGIVLSSRRRMCYAIGFLWAALRMRLRDLVAPLWVPVDWLLSVESRAHGVIALAVGTQILYIEHEDGLHALVTEGWGWCAGCGITLRLFVGWLRKIRGIELSPPQNDPRHP